MKLVRLIAMVAVFGAMSYGQTVTIQGTVLDPNGRAYQNGSGKATLVPQNQQWLFGTNPITSPVPIASLDSFGKFSISLTDTSLISPATASPQWQFSFCSSSAVASPPICFTMNALALTSSQDISTQIQAQAALLPTSGGPNTPPCLLANALQYNNGGVFGCDALMAYNAATHTLSVSAISVTGASVSGNGTACFISNIITNVGCPPVSVFAAGSSAEVQFRNSSTGLLSSDPQFSYNSSTHTISFLNAIVNGLMTWANPFGLNTSIPVTSACIPGAVGTSSFGISSDGNFATSSNGAPCVDIGGGVPLGASGQVPVMNSGATGYAPQTKPVIDVRDSISAQPGVDCSGATVSTAALQRSVNLACSFATTGATVLWPNRCAIKTDDTIFVTQCSGITLDGGQAQGQAAFNGGTDGAASIKYEGPAGRPALTINQTRDSTFRNLTVFANAANPAVAGANSCLLIDEIAPVTKIVTNNHFDDFQCYNGSSNSSFIGVNLCPTAPGNCESQNFDRLSLNCATASPTSSNNGIGIQIGVAGGSAQPNYLYLNWVAAKHCSQAIAVNYAHILDINGGLMDLNYTDLFLNSGDGITYQNFRTESGTAQIVIGTAGSSPLHEVKIEHNSFSGLSNGTTTISYPFATTGGVLRLISNTWDTNSTVIPFGATGAGVFVGTLDSQDNTLPNNTHCLAAAFTSSGAGLSSLLDSPSGGTCQYGGWIGSTPRGIVRTDPVLASTLIACVSGLEGSQKAVSDSNTKVGGATIAGGGTNHVLAYCDGTNWIVNTVSAPTITTAGQITSTLATGTAPFVIASATRVSNLYTSGNPGLSACGTTATCANTQQVNGFTAYGKATLAGGTLSYAGLPFASTTWLCNTWDITTPGTASSMVQVTDATHATITGTGTDVIGFHCDGN